MKRFLLGISSDLLLIMIRANSRISTQRAFDYIEILTRQANFVQTMPIWQVFAKIIFIPWLLHVNITNVYLFCFFYLINAKWS